MQLVGRVRAGGRRGKLAVVLLPCVVLLAACDLSIVGSDGSAPAPAVGAYGAYEPACSPTQPYDLYVGEVGSSASGGNTYIAPAANSTDNIHYIDDANASYNAGHGVGAGGYFFLSGPQHAPSGVSAYQWGVDEADYATEDFNAAQAATAGSLAFKFLMADIEIQPGNGAYFGWFYPAPANSLALAANELVWTGFYQALQGAGTNVGVYSSPAIWSEVQGDSNVSQVEWTSELDYGPPTLCPTIALSGGPGGTSAQFFGGQSSSTNQGLMWQWAEGPSGVSPGDFDNLDLTHYDTLLGINLAA
jgi:hypothetical protein